MKYGVIGVGRMGSILCGALAKAEAEVWGIDTYQPHVDAINSEGLTVNWGSYEETYKNVKATADAADVGLCDVVVVLVGGNYTAKAMESAKLMMDDHTLVFTLQNGYGHTNTIIESGVPESRVVYGVVGYGGSIERPGYMKALISPGSVLHFGPYDHNITDVHKAMARDMQAGGLEVSLDAEVDKEIWFKLGMNCLGNPTCGLAHCTLGIWSGSQFTRDLRYKLLLEVVQVANAKGVNINIEQFLPRLDRTIEQMGAMAHHYPSMAQDMFAKRKTEIEFLNGAVFHEGEKLGIPTPINETLYILTKAAEAAYELW